MKHLVKNVLFVGRDISFQKELLSKTNELFFNILGLRSSCAAINIIIEKKFDIIVIDENILTDEQYFGHERSSIQEIYDCTLKYNSQSAFIYIYEKNSTFVRNFQKRTNTTALLSRKIIVPEIFSYLMGLLTKEYFKVIFLSELRPGIRLDCNLYFVEQEILKSKTYLKKGVTLTREVLEHAQSKGMRHLYIKQDELNTYIDQKNISSKRTEMIHVIRENIRNLLINLLEHSPSSNSAIGTELYKKSENIINEIQEIILGHRDSLEALESLPFPRSNILNHYINSVIYSLIFSKILILDQSLEVGIAALVHDIGQAALNHNFTLDKDALEKMNYVQKIDNELHVYEGLKILRQNNFLLSKTIEDIIALHHENILGTGYPFGIKLEHKKLIYQILPLSNEIDYRRSITRGEIERSFLEVFNEIEQENASSKIFSNLLITSLSHCFKR